MCSVDRGCSSRGSSFGSRGQRTTPSGFPYNTPDVWPASADYVCTPRAFTAYLARGSYHFFPEITVALLGTTLRYLGLTKPISNSISLSALLGRQCPWWAPFVVNFVLYVVAILMVILLHLPGCGGCREVAHEYWRRARDTDSPVDSSPSLHSRSLPNFTSERHW